MPEGPWVWELDDAVGLLPECHGLVAPRAGRQPRPAAELSKPFSTTKTTRSKPFAHVSSAGRARWVSQCSGSVCVPLSRFDLPVEST